MDAVYRLGQSTVAEVLDELPDPPSYSSVRALMNILEQKGHLTHRSDGPRYVYRPTRPRHAAARSALRRMLDTFYDGSVERAVAALLNANQSDLSDDELKRLGELIDRARKEGR